MSSYGQSYDTQVIINKADSILRQNVNDSIYKYFVFDSSSYYEFSGFFRSSDFIGEYKGFLNSWGVKRLLKNKRSKGHFKETDVRFRFNYTPFKGIKGMGFVRFDSLLNLREPPYLAFIPDFLWKEKSCDFISYEKALIIAQNSFKYKGIEPISQYLEYDSEYKRYIYIIDNTLTKSTDLYGHDTGETEVVKIDAVTGEILDYYKGWYGPIY
jgi:hypothetical protein